MSSDIMNNQLIKGATANAQQPVSLLKTNSDERQSVAAASGSNSPPETTETQEPAKQVSEEKVREVVEELNNHAQSINRDLHFSVDDDSGRTVIKVFNSETAELVRQIPSEEVIKLSETIRESIEGGTGFIVQTSA